MTPRTTINLRHTGRVYIGMSLDDFKAFAWSMRFRAGVSQVEPRPQDGTAAYERLVSAIQSFERKFPEVAKSQ